MDLNIDSGGVCPEDCKSRILQQQLKRYNNYLAEEDSEIDFFPHFEGVEICDDNNGLPDDHDESDNNHDIDDLDDCEDVDDDTGDDRGDSEDGDNDTGDSQMNSEKDNSDDENKSYHLILRWILITFFKIVSHFRLSNNASSAILSFSFVLGNFI